MAGCICFFLLFICFIGNAQNTQGIFLDEMQKEIQFRSRVIDESREKNDSMIRKIKNHQMPLLYENNENDQDNQSRDVFSLDDIEKVIIQEMRIIEQEEREQKQKELRMKAEYRLEQRAKTDPEFFQRWEELKANRNED